jgi:hypothetical protein
VEAVARIQREHFAKLLIENGNAAWADILGASMDTSVGSNFAIALEPQDA